MLAEPAVDRSAEFRALVKDQLPRLYGIARRLVGDDAEDAVQEALLKAFRKMDQLREEVAAVPWLTAILINVCRDFRRKAARAPAVAGIDDVDGFSLYRRIADEDPFPYSDAVHLDFLCQFDTEDVRAVLDGLPDMYKTPLVLFHMEGFATKEIARILQVPLGTLLARLHRGRKQFEKALWDYAATNKLLTEGVR